MILDVGSIDEYLPRLRQRKVTMPRTASLKVIERKIRELQIEAEEIKQREKPGIKQLKLVVSRYHLTPRDLKIAFNGGGSKHGSVLRGKKLKPKYRNPANKSETWAGRGLKPKWVVASLKRGKKLEDLAV
jgi:DNA-binding protein H-NS